MPRCLLVSSALCALLFSQSCSTPPSADLQRHEFSEPQMGVPFRIVLYAADQEKATSSARAAFDRIRQLNDILSDYDDNSELSRLSKTSGQGRVIKVSDDLWRVLIQARKISEQSDGSFDVTVGPFVNLWRRARRVKSLPDPFVLAETRKAVGYGNLELVATGQTAKLLVPNMRLDLGGIAKGYAVDEALKVLRARGQSRALIAAAGDIAAGDPPPGKKGWRIEVAPLDVPNAPPARFVLLANRALSTSGDLFQHVEIDGVRYSHIVDPRSGIGLTDHSLVTVIARDGTTADALSTAVSVLGPKAGLKLIESTKGAAARIVRKPDSRIETAESSRFGKYCEQE
ncbi:MAG TPA: FAD:protein FMN transferase [Verrucomicrobiae bacterium]|nr:FAD:protein FMN transferase [Verrucomicrobiae bacterium]